MGGEEPVHRVHAEVTAGLRVICPTESEDAVPRRHEQATGQPFAPHDRPAVVIGQHLGADEPVRPVPPGIVQEPGGAEEVVDGRRQRLASRVEPRVPHKDGLAVAAQDVGQRPRHVGAALAGDGFLRLPARLGVAVGEAPLEHHLAGAGVQAVKEEAAIEKRGPPRHSAGERPPTRPLPVHHEDTAVHGPGGLEAAERDDTPVLRGSPEPPDEGAVGYPQTGDVAARVAEVHAAMPEGGGRIDPAARRRGPRDLAGRGVQGAHLVAVDAGHKHQAEGVRHAAQRSAKVGLPDGLHVVRDRRGRPAATGGVGPIHRPVGGIRNHPFSLVGFSVGGTTLQSCGRRIGLDIRLGGCGRQAVEGVQFRFVVARARVRRGVQQAVAREDAVLARAADPVVGNDVVAVHVDELDSRPPVNDVPRGSLIAVAPAVGKADRKDLLILRPLVHDLAGVQVVNLGDAGVALADGVPAPHFAVGNEDIDGGVERLGARGGPQALARIGGEGDHLTSCADHGAADEPLHPVLVLAARLGGGPCGPVGREDNAIAHDQRGRGERGPVPADGPLRLPHRLAGIRVEGHEVGLVLEEEPAAADGGGGRQDAGGRVVGPLPDGLAGVSIEHHEPPLQVADDVLLVDAAAGPGAETADHLGGRSLVLGRRFANDEVEPAAGQENLVRVRRALVRADDFAGGGVEGHNRLTVTKRHVNAVAEGDKAARQFRGAAAEGTEVVLPGSNLALPEKDAAEGIAGNEPPPGRGADGGDGALVDDRKEPTAG